MIQRGVIPSLPLLNRFRVLEVFVRVSLKPPKIFPEPIDRLLINRRLSGFAQLFGFLQLIIEPFYLFPEYLRLFRDLLHLPHCFMETFDANFFTAI